MDSPSLPIRPTDARAAALAAAEARLRPAPSIDAQPSTSTSSTPNLSSGPSAPSPHGRTPPLVVPTRKEPAWQPSEKGDREVRIQFSRLLDRGIVRDNSYKDAAVAVETLLMIANNIIAHNEPKYRDLKATNSMLKNKVLAVKGGHEYLIALGFRIRSVEFTQHYVLEPSLKKVHELKIGASVLEDNLSNLQSRAAQSQTSRSLASQEEAARKAKALREIEADRDDVKDRIGRDKRMREREERLAKEKEERKKREEEAREAAGLPGGMGDEEDGAAGGMTVGGGYESE